MLETGDGLGFIGRNPGDTTVHVVTGDSGIGMTHETIAGILIPALVTAGSHPWEAVFAPGRTPVRTAGEFVRENADVALQYAAWLSGGDVKSAADIKPGCGAVGAGEAGEAGGLPRRRRQAPHLLGDVPAPRGPGTVERRREDVGLPGARARFDAKGTVIQGPAITPLTPSVME